MPIPSALAESGPTGPQVASQEPEGRIEPEWAYHVTPVENWPAIESSGLIAQIGPRSRLLEARPAVFLFPTIEDCDTALGQWLGDEFEDVPEDGLIILEVNVAGLPYQQSVEFEKEVLLDIPADRIGRVLGEDWHEIPREVVGETTRPAPQ